MKNGASLHRITFIIIILGIITASIGLFYTTGGNPYDFVNQYGDKVKIYGDGLYAHDSYFIAPIFRGTDFTILFLAVPMLIVALLLDMKRTTLKSRIFLTSVIAVFTYYSSSISFGVTYNMLHLVYIALFSASLFGLIIALGSLDQKQVAASIQGNLPYKGLYVFLTLTGVALTVAWLPDIITSLIRGHSLALIQVYTTSITNVIDMGIITPVSFICLFYLKKRSGMGYSLLAILLTVCVVMGVMLPTQTLFQLQAGIELPLPILITTMGNFVALAFFALYFNVRLFKSIKH